MYSRLKLIKLATDPHEEADKNLRLAQKRYKNDYDRRVRFVPIFRIGDYIFLNRPRIFHVVAERSDSERYKK